MQGERRFKELPSTSGLRKTNSNWRDISSSSSAIVAIITRTEMTFENLLYVRNNEGFQFHKFYWILLTLLNTTISMNILRWSNNSKNILL